jgi:hypothetical protein
MITPSETGPPLEKFEGSCARQAQGLDGGLYGLQSRAAL